MAPTSRPKDDEDPFRSKHVYVMSRLQERRVHLRRRDPRRVRDREGPVLRRAPWLREYATGVLGGRRFVLRDTWGPSKGRRCTLGGRGSGPSQCQELKPRDVDQLLSGRYEA